MGCWCSTKVYVIGSDLEDVIDRWQLPIAQVQRLQEVFINGIELFESTNDLPAKRRRLTFKGFLFALSISATPYTQHLPSLCESHANQLGVHMVQDSVLLSFEDFVDVVCRFCLFDKIELVKYAFMVFDVDADESITASEFDYVVSRMEKLEKSGYAGDVLRMMRKEVADGFQDMNINLKTFQALVGDNERFLWPLTRLQQIIQRRTLGVSFCLKHRLLLDKMAAFKMIPRASTRNLQQREEEFSVLDAIFSHSARLAPPYSAGLVGGGEFRGYCDEDSEDGPDDGVHSAPVSRDDGRVVHSIPLPGSTKQPPRTLNPLQHVKKSGKRKKKHRGHHDHNGHDDSSLGHDHRSHGIRRRRSTLHGDELHGANGLLQVEKTS